MRPRPGSLCSAEARVRAAPLRGALPLWLRPTPSCWEQGKAGRALSRSVAWERLRDQGGAHGGRGAGRGVLGAGTVLAGSAQGTVLECPLRSGRSANGAALKVFCFFTNSLWRFRSTSSDTPLAQWLYKQASKSQFTKHIPDTARN